MFKGAFFWLPEGSNQNPGSALLKENWFKKDFEICSIIANYIFIDVSSHVFHALG